MRKILTVAAVLALFCIAVTTSAFAVTTTVTVGATVTAGTATLDLKSLSTGGTAVTSITIPAITMAAGATRANSTTPAFVQFFTGGGTYELKAYFTNTTGTSVASAVPKGLLNGTANYWPIKIWCANYGPTGTDALTGTPPNPNTDANWTGLNANWKWVQEKAYAIGGYGPIDLVAHPGYPNTTPATYNTDTRTTLGYLYPAGTLLPSGIGYDARMPSGFKISLAADGNDAPVVGTSTAYSGTMTLELTTTP
ncbi:MAG: hypothetical protein WCG78_00595 [Candidatus Omnitrophota bacterium]